MPATTTARMSIEQVRGTRMFQKRSVKERLWIETYIASGGDAVFATTTSFDCASEKIAKILSYEVQKKLQHILDLIYGRDEREVRAELAAMVRKQLKACEPGTVAAQRFTSQLERLLLGMPCEETSEISEPKAKAPVEAPGSAELSGDRFSVGDVVVQEGVTYRVTAIDADGKILEADEVQ